MEMSHDAFSRSKPYTFVHLWTKTLLYYPHYNNHFSSNKTFDLSAVFLKDSGQTLTT